jgi:uncharacterized protein YbaA (DUF1428 family)
MSYVDGFLIAIPKKNMAAYKKMATLGCKIWRKHGALDYKECVIDDAKPAHTLLPFPKVMKTKPHEAVVFSYIVFKSRKHRDAVNKKVMADPAMSPEGFTDTSMPFDMKRMAYGGFEAFVEY